MIETMLDATNERQCKSHKELVYLFSSFRRDPFQYVVLKVIENDCQHHWRSLLPFDVWHVHNFTAILLAALRILIFNSERNENRWVIYYFKSKSILLAAFWFCINITNDKHYLKSRSEALLDEIFPGLLATNHKSFPWLTSSVSSLISAWRHSSISLTSTSRGVSCPSPNPNVVRSTTADPRDVTRTSSLQLHKTM